MRVLITGGSSGLGAALVQACLERGDQVLNADLVEPVGDARGSGGFDKLNRPEDRLDRPGFDGLDRPGFDGLDRQGFDKLNRQGSDKLNHQEDGLDRQGFDGLNRQGFDGLNHQGFDRLNRQGFDGLNHQGFDRLNHQGFDKLNRQGFDRLDRQGFDRLDRPGFDRLNRQGFDKLNHQEDGLDRQGFDKLNHRGFDRLNRQGFDKLNRPGDSLDRPGEGFLRLDIREERDWAAVREWVEDTWGGLDLLVNNAGVAGGGRIDVATIDEWQWITDINLFGMVRGLREFVPMMKAQGSGHIVNVASLAGLVHPAGMASYNAVKAAVVALTETLGHELAQWNIRTSVVCPSYFKTNLVASMQGRDEAAGRVIAGLVERSPFTADQIAAAILEGVERGEQVIIPDPAAQAAVALKREAPGDYDALMRAQARKLQEAAGD